MPIAIHWFRRDLRLDDNTALWHALAADVPVLCLFIFDTNILDHLTDKYDRRVDFIYRQIQAIAAKLAHKNSTLLVKYGNPLDIWDELSQQYDLQTNRMPKNATVKCMICCKKKVLPLKAIKTT